MDRKYGREREKEWRAAKGHRVESNLGTPQQRPLVSVNGVLALPKLPGRPHFSFSTILLRDHEALHLTSPDTIRQFGTKDGPHLGKYCS